MSNYQLSIQDKQTLYQAYMPFIQGGALFVETSDNHSLDHRVQLHLQLFDKTYDIMGNVVWVTPKQSQQARKTGIGISLADAANGELRKRIETSLVGMENLELATDTL